jgi:hypothetical protein
MQRLSTVALVALPERVGVAVVNESVAPPSTLTIGVATGVDGNWMLLAIVHPSAPESKSTRYHVYPSTVVEGFETDPAAPYDCVPAITAVADELLRTFATGTITCTRVVGAGVTAAGIFVVVIAPEASVNLQTPASPNPYTSFLIMVHVALQESIVFDWLTVAVLGVLFVFEVYVQTVD